MPFKPSFPWWWLAATLACCLVLYMANPNDHSTVRALLGLLISLLYVELRGAVALGKNWMAAYLRTKHEGFSQTVVAVAELTGQCKSGISKRL